MKFLKMKNQTSKEMQILRLLDIKLKNKEEEMKTLANPSMDRLDQNYQNRKFQVEVEFWQLKNIIDDCKAICDE